MIRHLKIYSILFLLIFITVSNNVFSQNKKQKIDYLKITEKPIWIKNYPLPKIYENLFKNNPKIQEEVQYNNVLKETFYREYYYINYENDLSKEFLLKINRDEEIIELHSLRIYRDDEELNILEINDFDKNELKQNIGEEVLLDFVTFKIENSSFKIGDVVEFSYTLKKRRTNKQNSFYHEEFMTPYDLNGLKYFLIIENGGDIITQNLDTVNLKKYRKGGMNYLESYFDNSKTINQKKSRKSIVFYQDQSWESVVSKEFVNLELDKSPSENLKKKVVELTKNSQSTEEKIKAVFDFIQKDIDNLEKSNVNSNYADKTLELTYGSKLAKTILTVKMLEVLGVKSWPILGNLKNSREEFQKIISASSFDESAIEYVFENDTLTFNPFTEPTIGRLKYRQFDKFYYGLRVHPEDAKIIFPQENSQENNLKITAVFDPLDKSAMRKEYPEDGRYKFDLDINFRGSIINKFNLIYQKGNDLDLKINFFNLILDSSLSFYNQRISNNIQIFTIDKEKEEVNVNIKLNDTSGTFNVFKTFVNPIKMCEELNETESWYKVEALFFKKKEVLLKIKKTDSIHILSPKVTEIKRDWVKYNKEVWETKDTIFAAFTLEYLKPLKNIKENAEIPEFIQEVTKANNIFDVYNTDLEEEENEYDYTFEKQEKLEQKILILLVLVILSWIVYIVIRLKYRKLNN
ncbi:hypothetical protein [Aureivirga sp. CE67]|uniref:hypothetical protein n=1 Tax=Aureivirga sp. CE67 TaxID=1788983 RepID=UPI0018C91150|nr:hypothetical protein [Aureivirga sp. CE67]